MHSNTSGRHRTDTENFDDDPTSKDVNSSVEPSESETLPDTEAPNSQGLDFTFYFHSNLFQLSFCSR